MSTAHTPDVVAGTGLIVDDGRAAVEELPARTGGFPTCSSTSESEILSIIGLKGFDHAQKFGTNVLCPTCALRIRQIASPSISASTSHLCQKTVSCRVQEEVIPVGTHAPGIWAHSLNIRTLQCRHLSGSNRGTIFFIAMTFDWKTFSSPMLLLQPPRFMTSITSPLSEQRYSCLPFKRRR